MSVFSEFYEVQAKIGNGVSREEVHQQMVQVLVNSGQWPDLLYADRYVAGILDDVVSDRVSEFVSQDGVERPDQVPEA